MNNTPSSAFRIESYRVPPELRQYFEAAPCGKCFVCVMLEVFREVRRVLHESGTCWLNLGDSYVSHKPRGSAIHSQSANIGSQYAAFEAASQSPDLRGKHDTLKDKDLCGIPWRVVLALQADGWYWRSTIVWHKKSCMPESVTDRPTNSWEPIFLLAKRASYFYDAEAVKEPIAESTASDSRLGDDELSAAKRLRNRGGRTDGLTSAPGSTLGSPSGRNQRNVWSLGPEPYSEAHFATFPTEIPRRAILAGTSARGCCPKCLTPWERIVSAPSGGDTGKSWHDHNGDEFEGNKKASGGQAYKTYQPGKTVGWRPGCECNAGEPVPATVLDCFGGSGTTGAVALELGRKAILCELNDNYLPLIKKRTDVTPGLQLA